MKKIDRHQLRQRANIIFRFLFGVALVVVTFAQAGQLLIAWFRRRC